VASTTTNRWVVVSDAAGFTKQTATPHPHLQNISSDLHELRKWS